MTSDGDSDAYWESSSTTSGSVMYTGTTTMAAEDSDNETMTVTMTRSSSMVDQDIDNATMTTTNSSWSMVTEDSDNETMTTSALSSTSTYARVSDLSSFVHLSLSLWLSIWPHLYLFDRSSHAIHLTD